MTSRAPSRNRLSRPGERSVDGRKSSSPSRTCSMVAPRPRAPPAAASALATLWPASPPMVIGTRAISTTRVAALAVHLGQPAVRSEVGPATTGQVAPDDDGQRPRRRPREERHASTHAAGDGRDERVVAVEHDPAVRVGDPADRGLDLGQLGERVDALQVEVVGRDVGQDRGVVGLVAHAAQDDAAAGRLEHGDVDVGAGPGSSGRRPGRSSRPGRPSARRRGRRRRSSSRRGARRPAGCG